MKKNKGCLKVIGIGAAIGVVGFILLVAIAISNDDDNNNDNEFSATKEHVNAVSEREKTIQDSLCQERIIGLEKTLKLSSKKFTTTYDDIEELTWIYPKSKPYYVNNKAFFLYLGMRDNGQVWQRLVIRYHGDDWLFLQKITIKTDNNTYTLNAYDSKRDNNSEVWEWIDINATDSESIIIDDIISSKKTKVRFEGKQYYKDWILTKSIVEGLKDIRSYYMELDELYMLKK